MKLIEKHRSYQGYQEVYQHTSKITKCDMKFSLYKPDQFIEAPVLYFLSGITCTEQNFIQKSGFQQFASNHQMAVIVPDTSPRGQNVPDHEDYKIGCGAGFYVNATAAPWSTHYNMYDYVTKELPEVIENNFQFSNNKIGISGHSMGGGGAIQCALKNDLYKSLSAISPICSLNKSMFAKEMFSHYLNNDAKELNLYDPITLVKQYSKKFNDIRIDVGLDDDFLNDLFIDDFVLACEEKKQKISVNRHEGYDHGYYFIHSFIKDHIEYHSKILKNI